MVSAQAAKQPGFVGALEPLVGSISSERMRRANLRVDRAEEKMTPAEAAGWLAEQAKVN